MGREREKKEIMWQVKSNNFFHTFALLLFCGAEEMTATIGLNGIWSLLCVVLITIVRFIDPTHLLDLFVIPALLSYTNFLCEYFPELWARKKKMVNFVLRQIANTFFKSQNYGVGES